MLAREKLPLALAEQLIFSGTCTFVYVYVQMYTLCHSATPLPKQKK